MAWFEALDITILNNEKNVLVNSGESIDNIRAGDAFKISGFDEKEVAQAYVEDGTGNKIIELVKDWSHTSQINVACLVKPSGNYFLDAVLTMEKVRADILEKLGLLIVYASTQSGTVDLPPLDGQGPDEPVRTIGQMDTDVKALENSANTSVESLNIVNSAINDPGGLIEQVDDLTLALSNIDETLSGYVQSCSDDAYQTGQDKIATGQDRVATGQDRTQTGQDRVATGQDKTACNQAVIAAQEAQEAAEQAAENAENIAGGTAPDSNKLGGKLANVYYNSVDNKPTKATVELDQVDNTSDANKPISDATQLALNDKLEADDLAGYATTAALEDIEALALAGL